MMAYHMTAAIDFGTSFSGYAYSFAADKEEILVNKNWEVKGAYLHKTPTCLLLKPDGQFEAFGIDAIDRYNELEENAAKYYFFDHFKMKLYNNTDLKRDIMLKDVDGKEKLGIDVFAESLKFMKKHILKAVRQSRSYEPDSDTVRWVLTVPAIWEENAKQFMREAAYRGSLIPEYNSDQLVIALEPEAASIHCRHLLAKGFKNHSRETLPTFDPGTKYLVVDAGGGTVDCVAHKIQKDGKVKELFQANGGPWGGTFVDKEFLKQLDRIFGVQFMDDFKQKHPKGYVELLQDFEIKKRKHTETTRVRLPYEFCNFENNYAEIALNAFEDKCNNEVTFISGKLSMTSSFVDTLFAGCLKSINDHVFSLLQKQEAENLNIIFLVGGFADSSRLEESLTSFLGTRIKCLIPEDAGLAVLKGAIAFGHDPTLVWKRVCRFTYGTEIVAKFEDGHHKEDLKSVIEGQNYCTKIFSKWIEAGTTIGYNHVCQKMHSPVHTNQKRIVFKFFRSLNKNVKYTDEEGLHKCGSLEVEMPDLTGDKKRNVRLEVVFGGTEIKVKAHDITSSSQCETRINFLS